MRIKDIMKESHERAVRKGFYDPPPTICERLVLVHSEVSEAVEDFRAGKLKTTLRSGDGKPEGLPSELADIVIRVFDMAEYYGIDLEKEIRTKSDYNELRPHRHGGKAI